MAPTETLRRNFMTVVPESPSCSATMTYVAALRVDDHRRGCGRDRCRACATRGRSMRPRSVAHSPLLGTLLSKPTTHSDGGSAAEGWLYVAAVIDLFSRRVVGWSMSAAMTAQLVADALVMAIWRRGKPDALLLRSRQSVHQRAVPAVAGRSWCRLLDEPFRQRVRQCGDGELLLVAQDRAHSSQNLSNQRGRQS